MATYSGYLFTGIPENADSDQLLVYSSATSSGTFALEETLDYTYSTKVTEYEVNQDLWYKVKFAEALTGWETPLSDPVDGSQILKSAPTLDITSTNDGVSYATSEDVYARSNLTVGDIPENDINYSLSVAKAFIDIRLSTMSLDRFNVFSSNVARRKFNALIKLLQDVEINYALSLVYRHMADDAIMSNTTAGTKTSTSVSVGQTSMGGIEGGDTINNATYFDALSTRYAAYASDLLGTLTPNYVPLRYSESGTGYTSKFISFAGSTVTFNFADGIILDRLDL